jgi:hypothetical protein
LPDQDTSHKQREQVVGDTAHVCATQRTKTISSITVGRVLAVNGGQRAPTRPNAETARAGLTDCSRWAALGVVATHCRLIPHRRAPLT